MKRTLDIVVATLVLLLSLPVILVAAALVRLCSRGPWLYSQQRDGRNGRPFRLYKLRTMVVDADDLFEERLRTDPRAAEEWARYLRLADDPRIVPFVGRLLRRLSIDELPQLWNVFRGHMSLVGPRPLPLPLVEHLSPPFVEVRRRVRPGLTGLWQVDGRSDNDIQALERIDTWYVEHASMSLDLRILLRTPLVVAGGKGAY